MPILNDAQCAMDGRRVSRDEVTPGGPGGPRVTFDPGWAFAIFYIFEHFKMTSIRRVIGNGPCWTE
jgi:hypothetical protein